MGSGKLLMRENSALAAWLVLGGDQVVGAVPATAVGLHDALVRGLPGEAIGSIVEHVPGLANSAALAAAFGLSLTALRRRGRGGKRLTSAQSGRVWTVAGIIALAIKVLGTGENAAQWLETPAIGIDQRRPIDLLASPIGARLVEDTLQRMDWGVYF